MTLHSILLGIGYFFICYLIAFLGRKRKFGFWGYLFLTIFLTPIVGFIALLAADPKDENKR
jgi:hypothetical protein